MVPTEATEVQEFSSGGARLIFDAERPWKDWETAGVGALLESLGAENTWTRGDLLRFLHLAVSYRNDGNSGSDFNEEDIALAKDLLLKSRDWREKSRPTWTPEIRNAFKDIVFLQGRDKCGSPVGVVRPQESNRDTWAVDLNNLNKAILALVDTGISNAYLPGVAEQCIWIIDLHAIGIMDLPQLVPSLQHLVSQLSVNFPSRAGTFFIINAGWALSAAVNAVMLFAMAETRQKVQVFSGLFNDAAKDRFDVEMLPVEFGGEGFMGSLEEVNGTEEKPPQEQ
eukprot:CAMPEP_0172745918 /NCGR_PEP_ID=MMETSP1074-20121228/139159_1 /TAXON_ID=2916 /ORGANISM="Ceratium fusus, Strain PA161109" /LENGTH=281 /DNA_ID=CAMNT_0013577183 /DNA_START=60 /DNA_END=902 /DNA_ORIENTATION=+